MKSLSIFVSATCEGTAERLILPGLDMVASFVSSMRLFGSLLNSALLNWSLRISFDSMKSLESAQFLIFINMTMITLHPYCRLITAYIPCA